MVSHIYMDSISLSASSKVAITHTLEALRQVNRILYSILIVCFETTVLSSHTNRAVVSKHVLCGIRLSVVSVSSVQSQN
jgi:hypothetical protein